jgi:hypothetical protein
MKHEQDEREGQRATPAKNSRQQRLKLALRENLKRRKSQARARDDLAGAPAGGVDGSADEGASKPADS